MEASTTADLLSVDVKVAYLITAQVNIDENDPGETGVMCEEVSGAHPAISIEGKLAAVKL